MQANTEPAQIQISLYMCRLYLKGESIAANT